MIELTSPSMMFTYFKTLKHGRTPSSHPCPQHAFIQQQSITNQQLLSVEASLTGTLTVNTQLIPMQWRCFKPRRTSGTMLSLYQLHTVACHVQLLMTHVISLEGPLVMHPDNPYCTSVSNLISRALPPDHPETSSTPQASPSPPTWQVLPECPLSYLTAAELGGGLLAIGGKDRSESTSSAVHMYSPSTNSWVRISSGDLPVPRQGAAATQLERGEVIFVGGNVKLNSPIKTVFIVSTEQ